MQDSTNIGTVLSIQSFGGNASNVYVDLTYAEHFKKWATENHLVAHEIDTIANTRNGYRVNATPEQLEAIIPPWIDSLTQY